MRIYVGTYAKYNNGSIVGAWLDLEDYSDKDEFIDAALELHKDESDPELMFQDWEGSRYLISECSVEEAAWDFMELEETEQSLVEHLLSEGWTIENALSSYEDCRVIPCDYLHEAGEVYFDDIMEQYGNPELPFSECYINKQALFEGDGNDYNFVEGVGLVSTP